MPGRAHAASHLHVSMTVKQDIPTSILKLGHGLLSPGRRSRARALRESARAALGILWGAAGMLVVAAFIEAFWSSSTLVTPALKYAVGGLLWSAVLGYLVLAGRGGGD